MDQSKQFVTFRKFQPVNKKSSFYLMIENIEELLQQHVFESKNISFLDSDAVW